MSGNVTTWPPDGLRSFMPAALPALAAAVYGWAVFASTFHHPGSIGLNYVAPGSDWMVLYGAVRLAMHNQLGLTLDSDGFTAYVNSAFSHWLPHPMFYRPWVYPPSFLVILWPFGLLGFVGSYIAFQLVGTATLAAALLVRPGRRSAAKWMALAILICPAASINVVDGQCGFLVAGLLVLGFRLMPVRPVLAGVILGLVSFKPQFGLMVPLALLALRQWRGIAGAAASSLALASVSVAAFGWQPWLWWINRAALSYGHAGSEWASFERMWGNSVYACVSLLGAPPIVGLIMQVVAVASAAAFVFLAYRRRLGADTQLAVLLAATILAAPHFSTYDELLLALAGMLWFGGLGAPRLMDAILVLTLWLAPILAPPALVPVGLAEPLLVIGFMMVALRGPLTPGWTVSS